MTVRKLEEYKQLQCDTRHRLNTRGIQIPGLPSFEIEISSNVDKVAAVDL
jgi:hypothetical protein